MLENEPRLLTVRSYYPLTTVLVSIFQIVLFSVMAYNQYQHLLEGWGSLTLLRTCIGIVVVYAALAIVSLYYMRKPPYQLELSDHSLKMRRRELESGQIKQIYVSWADNPVIGIKPYGWWVIPNDYTFKFQEGKASESVARELMQWAERNGIRVIRRTGIRLI